MPPVTKCKHDIPHQKLTHCDVLTFTVSLTFISVLNILAINFFCDDAQIFKITTTTNTSTDWVC